MNIKKLLAVGLVVGGCAIASPVGTLGIGSTGVVNATLTSILFTPDAGYLGTCPGAPCNGDVNSGTTLVFAGGPLTVGEGILINNGLPFGAPPPVGATIYNPFLQFAIHSNLTFTLTGVDPGSSNTDCAAASLVNGGTCSILEAGTPSPVILTRNGSNTNVAISLFGMASDGVGLSSRWTGGFSATIPDKTPLDLAQFFCGADAVCTAAEVAASPTLEVRSTSGSFFVTMVPEPNTPIMLGGGLLLLSLALRRVNKHQVS